MMEQPPAFWNWTQTLFRPALPLASAILAATAPDNAAAAGNNWTNAVDGTIGIELGGAGAGAETLAHADAPADYLGRIAEATFEVIAGNGAVGIAVGRPEDFTDLSLNIGGFPMHAGFRHIGCQRVSATFSF